MSKKEFKPYLAFNEIVPKIRETEKAFEKLCNAFDVLAKNEECLELKRALLFFVDVATSESSSNWKWDMENACQRLFNCSYEEANEKYGDYDGSWWELGE